MSITELQTEAGDDLTTDGGQDIVLESSTFAQIDNGTSAVTMRPGQWIVRPMPLTRQKRLVSSDGTVRIVEVSTTDGEFLTVEVVELPEADEGIYDGKDSLETFLTSTVDWSTSTATISDSDGDMWTVRFWDDELHLREVRKGVWSGRLRFRVEV